MFLGNYAPLHLFKLARKHSTSTAVTSEITLKEMTKQQHQPDGLKRSKNSFGHRPCQSPTKELPNFSCPQETLEHIKAHVLWFRQ